MPLFNKENAASMGSKGAKLRWDKELAAEQRRLTALPLAKIAEDDFKNEVLGRVRKQLRLLLDKADVILEKRDMDMKEMRDLGVAIKDLESVEARLSNRPAPGNLRPVAQTKRQSRSSFPEPSPVEYVIESTTPVSQESSTKQTIDGDWNNVLF